MARSQLSALPVLMCLLALTCGAFANESRRMLAKAEGRALTWIDPAAKPSSTAGFDVIISIVCPGKYNTVGAFKLRLGLGKCGLPTSNSKLAFGGNAAQAGYTYMASFTVNIASAGSQQDALNAVQQVTVAALAAASGVKINTIFFSAFSASG